MKRCSDCQVEKSLDEFYRHARRGRQSLCKECSRARTSAHRLKNPGYSREWYQKNAAREARNARLRKYGMTPDEWEQMLLQQGFKCAVCKDDLDLGRFTHIDHDHATGEVRGILCRACNTSLGQMKEDPYRIRALADYAARWEKVASHAD